MTTAEEKQLGAEYLQQLANKAVALAASSYVHFVDNGGLYDSEAHKEAFQYLKTAVLAERAARNL